jgi:hypothetical protein
MIGANDAGKFMPGRAKAGILKYLPSTALRRIQIGSCVFLLFFFF